MKKDKSTLSKEYSPKTAKGILRKMHLKLPQNRDTSFNQNSSQT